jgi:uncharacterized glyoxalase superfamily metalloenzyme YdcJ
MRPRIDGFISKRELRSHFAHRLSAMFAREVPLYDVLVHTVKAHNREILLRAPSDESTFSLEALSTERHGAIRLAQPKELRDVASLFRALGMFPVGFYDLTRGPTGKRQPVISTAFRPVRIPELERAPFRMFTSLLCIDDRRFFTPDISRRFKDHVSGREILSERLRRLIAKHDVEGGTRVSDAKEFLDEAISVLAWKPKQSVPEDLYEELYRIAPIAADVILEPHLNHLTPRSLDIESLHHRMSAKAAMKDDIEGPPARNALIFLRQTSYKALSESREVMGAGGITKTIQHRARFGEIEQRGVAMTPKGRALYDQAILKFAECKDAQQAFAGIPDDHANLREHELAYYRYEPTPSGLDAASSSEPKSLKELIGLGHILAHPIRYEDFLPISAAGIFGSNLDGGSTGNGSDDSPYSAKDLEAALGAKVLDPEVIYAAQRARSIVKSYGLIGREIPHDLSERVHADLLDDPRDLSGA